MFYDELKSMTLLAALAIFVAEPSACSAGDEVEAGAAVGIGSPIQVTEDILQLRETFGGAWREIGGASTPETTAAEEEAIRTALLDQARSNPIPRAENPAQDFDQKATLRGSAHQLDLVAHTLECQELYEQADELREIAQRLRLQARQKPPVALHKSGNVWKPVARHAAD